MRVFNNANSRRSIVASIDKHEQIARSRRPEDVIQADQVCYILLLFDNHRFYENMGIISVIV